MIEAYSHSASAEWSSNPKHLLTIAYAYEHAGQPLQALTYSKAALSFTNTVDLTPAEAALAELIHLKSRSEIGLIPEGQYAAELKVFVERHPDTSESTYCQLELILRDMVTGKPLMHEDPIVRLETLHERATKLVKSVDGPDVVDEEWALHLLLARIEFQLRDQLLMDAKYIAAANMGHPIPLSERLLIARQVLPVAKSAFDRLERLAKTAKSGRSSRSRCTL